MAKYFLGLDLGQSQDFTAIAVLERTEISEGWDAAWWTERKLAGMNLRYLERVPLGTTYPEVVERVRTLTRSGQMMGQCQLAVDATGVGRPVVELLRAAGLGCTIRPAVVTGGYAEGYENGYYHVPKRDLIVGLQVLLQKGGLRIAARLKYGQALVEEMAAMKVKQTPNGHEQLGVWREGEHDDLVFAVALAYWAGRKTGG